MNCSPAFGRPWRMKTVSPWPISAFWLRRRSNEELDEGAAAAIEDPQDNPEVALQNRQKAEILLNCLTQLAPAHREVIDLVYYHEKSIDEVAEITGVPQSTVQTRMFYARSRDDHHLPRSGRAGQHWRWGRGRARLQHHRRVRSPLRRWLSSRLPC